MIPTTAAQFARRARTRRNSGDLDGAWHDLTRALELDPAATSIRGARACLFYDNGFLEEALADFRIACATRTRGSQDYHRFRIWLCQSRLGREAAGTRELRAYLREGRRASDWTGNLAGFLCGDLPEKNLLAAATTSGERCEAHFYAASRRLLRRDRDAALRHFRASIRTDQESYTEWRSAQSELARLTR